MKSKIPLTVAVAGALLIGGATTGTTRASWTSQASLNSSSISSGQMSYTATTPAGVTVDKVAGSTADTTFILDDTSAGKNLTQRITASVGTTPTGVTATIGTTCPGTASVFVDTTPTSLDQELCVRVTSSTEAVSGNVTINLSSAQRPTAGWTTTAITRAVAVTVSQPAPAAPTLTCQPRNGNDISFTWPTVAGVTYTVHSATTNANANYSSGFAPSGTGRHTVSPGDPFSTYYRVKAINASGISGFSNTVLITRNGGASTIACAQVTP